LAYKNFLRAFFAISGLIICVLASCAKTESSRIELALGTVCSITLFEQGQESVYDEIFSRIREIESLMSVNIPSSDVSRINAAAGIEPVQVDKDTFKVIAHAIYFAELSGGALDPTVGPLVALWGINSPAPHVPTQEEINSVLPLVNWRNVELYNQSVYLTRRGMALDLGAIAKGYAADEAARIIREAGINRARIDLGGNIILIGQKKDRSPWRVGIQNPEESHGAITGILQIPEQSVVTSGIYERFFEENGKRYHHIFLPSNGYPVDNGLTSVTIITENSIDADALSTSVFVLGYERGRLLLESIPQTEAVFIFSDRSIRTTPGAMFILTDKSFSVKR
jgi:thiamine biosynthesis lipoprotein